MTPSDDDLARLTAAVDTLLERVEDVENIAQVANKLLERATDDGQRITDLRRALDDLRRVVDERLDGVAGATEALVVRRPDGTITARPVAGIDWRTILTVASVIVVPIVVAIITTRAGS
jgi:ElaB/YqjD/DUF883 family membrane-anchored ribosome-binding protein